MNPNSNRARERRHKAWIDQHLKWLFGVAREGYTRAGRGAIVILPTTGREATVSYVSETVAAQSECGWPDATVARIVANYPPLTHMVVLIEEDQRISTYRVGVFCGCDDPQSARH